VALRWKDEHQDVEVVALSLGASRVDDALREAIARGADRAVLVSDAALADVKADTPGAARLLAATVERLGDVGLVVCGAVALDSGAGEMPGRLAEALGWPMLSHIHAIDALGDGVVRVAQRAVQLEADLPALLTVPQGVNRPRHMHGARAMTVYSQGEVLAWGLDDLGFTAEDLEPLTWVSGQRFPPERSLGARLEGSLEEAVESLVAHLRAREVI
jgi:electron transfer flavoprotein beta subunit